jgi:hypothetical protein
VPNFLTETQIAQYRKNPQVVLISYISDDKFPHTFEAGLSRSLASYKHHVLHAASIYKDIGFDADYLPALEDKMILVSYKPVSSEDIGVFTEQALGVIAGAPCVHIGSANHLGYIEAPHVVRKYAMDTLPNEKGDHKIKVKVTASLSQAWGLHLNGPDLECILRKTVADGKYIDWHTDVAQRTTQIPLTDDDECDGGHLIFADGRVHRKVGLPLTHDGDEMHAVTPLNRGVRMGLYILED